MVKYCSETFTPEERLQFIDGILLWISKLSDRDLEDLHAKLEDVSEFYGNLMPENKYN